MNDAPRPMLDLHHLGHRQTGNETWARSIAAALFRVDGPSSYDIAVTAAAPAGDVQALQAREVVRLGEGSVRRLAWQLPAAMRRLRTSAVLVQYTAPVSSVPLVLAVHDLSFEHPQARDWLSRSTRLRYRATIRLSARRAEHVLALSENTRCDLIHNYGISPRRVTVVHAAVDPVLHAQLRQAPARRDGPLTVLAVGNVLPRKNLVVVARAVRMLRDRGHDVRFRVVGSVTPGGVANAAEMVGLLGEALELCGHVDQTTLVNAYKAAHVLAFPSLFEGFGIPVLEAMAAHLPVVVSDRTALPEIVGEAGIIVPAEDSALWAEALWTVLGGGAGERLVRLGARRQGEFSWDASAGQVSAIFASLVSASEL